MKTKLEYTDLLVVIDTREQRPLDLSPLRTTRGTLDTGDYTLYGLESEVAYERKSLSDFVACCGVERDRFCRELKRLMAYETRGILIEADMIDLLAGRWRSKITPASVVGSYYAWSNMGIPIYLCGNREGAIEALRKLLYDAGKKRWSKLSRFFVATAESQPASVERRNHKKALPTVGSSLTACLQSDIDASIGA